MNRDVFVTPTRAALAAGAVLATIATTPVAAGAASGGTTTAAAAAAPVAAPASSARKPAFRVTTERGSGLVGRTAVYAGRVAHAVKGQRVRLEVRSGRRWRVADRDTVGAKGAFRVTAKIARVGDRSARLRIVERPSVSPGAVERVRRVHGFRRAFASYYGPGLYGGALACGGRLTPGTIGVAHKSLPCGTKLTLRLGGRQVAARVVDRGPYVGGREFDLTAATKSRLGFGSTGNILVDR